MKKNKRFWIVGIVVLSMIGVTGCMSRGINDRKDREKIVGMIKEKERVDLLAIDKFKHKYDVDCEVVYTEVIDDSLENRDEIHVYVEEFMEEGEEAIIYSWSEDGQAISRDNLFGYIIREDYEERVKEVVLEYFADAKVYVDFTSTSFDDSLVQDSTLEDAYTVGEKMIASIDIIVASEDSEEIFAEKGEVICDALKETQLYGTVHIYSMSSNVYREMIRMNYKDAISVNGYEPDEVTMLDVYRGDSFDL